MKQYLDKIAAEKETYAGRTIYDIPVEGRTLRVAQLGYDTIGASNMPTAEQIHSIVDRSRTSAVGKAGSSLLASHYHDVPLLAQAWGIGHIGLPFTRYGELSVMGFDVPLADTTDLIASLRYSGSLKLRVEELAPDDASAQRTTDALNAVLNILRGISAEQPSRDDASSAMRSILQSAAIEQKHNIAVLTVSATLDQMKALSSAKPNATDELSAPASDSSSSPSADPARK